MKSLVHNNQIQRADPRYIKSHHVDGVIHHSLCADEQHGGRSISISNAAEDNTQKMHAPRDSQGFLRDSCNARLMRSERMTDGLAITCREAAGLTSHHMTCDVFNNNRLCNIHSMQAECIMHRHTYFGVTMHRVHTVQ